MVLRETMLEQLREARGVLICIFCRANSSSSRSIEHVIPESLGNTTFVLPPGVVCDSCNNYFSIKVERPFLESAEIRRLRFEQALPSKRKRVPSSAGILLPFDVPVTVRREPHGRDGMSLDVPIPFFSELLERGSGALALPVAGDALPSSSLLSRFMAKAALEAMAARVVAWPAGIKYMAKEQQLDPIRNHARRGEPTSWEVHVRRIYPSNRRWSPRDATGAPYQVVHESDILHTTWGEYFFVLAVFGLELTINYGGPDMDGYVRWLAEHDGDSPLHIGKNAGVLP